MTVGMGYHRAPCFSKSSWCLETSAMWSEAVRILRPRTGPEYKQRPSWASQAPCLRAMRQGQQAPLLRHGGERFGQASGCPAWPLVLDGAQR